MAPIDAAIMIIIVGVAHGGLLHNHQGGYGGATSSQNFVSLHYGGHYDSGEQNIGGQVQFASDAGNNIFGGISGSVNGAQYAQGAGNGIEQVAFGGGFGQGAAGGYAGISDGIGGQAFGGDVGLEQQIGQEIGGAGGLGGVQGAVGHGSYLQGIEAGVQNIGGFPGQSFGGFHGAGGIGEQSFGGGSLSGQGISGIAGDTGVGIATQGAGAPYPASTYGLPGR